MGIRRTALCWTLLAGVLPAGEVEAGQSQERAQRAYEAALETSDEGRRIELLRRSYEEHETYGAALMLGETYLGAGEREQAREWLQAAYDAGGTREFRARALFRIGESYADEGRWAQAVDYLARADGLHHMPMFREALREARGKLVDRIVTSEEIVDALTEPKIGTVVPRINLHINFDFDSARMTRDGRAQAEELGEAMIHVQSSEQSENRDGRRKRWLLVGHTDSQGARSYNQALSLRRADAVRAYLVEEFRFDSRDIVAEGRGEDELLDAASLTEAAHSVNRRVEVVRR